MGEWVWWILTCGLSLYLLKLLNEFKLPAQKLQEQIDNQETRRIDMGRRFEHAQQQIEEVKIRRDKLENDIGDHEERRKEVLPSANKRLMIHVSSGPFTMGGRDEGSPCNERPAHTVFLSDYYISR